MVVFNAKISTLVGGLDGAFVGLSSKDDILPYLEELKDKELTVEIKEKSKLRSLNSNAYLWVLLDKMARVIGKTDKDSLYLEMLERYGKFTPIVVRPEAAERMQKQWRACKVLGEVKVNDQVGVQMLCFYGSSTYDQKEMSDLIDGVVSECKELGIQTMTPAQLKEMNERWEPLYDYS